MAFKKSLGRLGGKRHDEAIIGVRQIYREIVRLLLHPRDNNQRFAEIGLRLARSMRQRHKDLPAAYLLATNVVLHDRVAARELVFFLEPVEDPLRRMSLLRRPLLVVFKDRVDHGQPRPQLGTLDRLLSLIARWHRILQHLPNRLAGQPELPGYRSLALPLDSYRSPNTPVYLH